MAGRSGTKGTVFYKGVSVADINTWNMDVNVADHDVTVFSTAPVTWRSRTPGLVDASGTFSGFWSMDTSTAQVDLQTNVLTPATGTIKLEADKETGGSYSMDAILGMSINVGIDDTANLSFPFVSNGAVTYATAT